MWFVLPLVSIQVVPGASGVKIRSSQAHDFWNQAAGFPGGFVHSIAQTADGYLWIATSKGLIRYDGLTFSFMHDGYLGTNAKTPIVGLVTDASGALWATDDRAHLFKYTNNRLEGPLPDKAKHRYGAVAVNITRDGWLLIASEDQGLVEYQHGISRVLVDPSITPNSVTAVAETADGRFWIGTSETGLFRIDLSKAVPEVKQVSGVPYARINCLLPIGASSLLAGTDRGLLAVKDGKTIPVLDPELDKPEILALAKGHDGDVWVGTANRVFKVDARHVNTGGRMDVVDDFSVQFPAASLFEDQTGNLWIGGAEAVERYRTEGFTTYLNSDGLPCANCGAIYADAEGSLWFAPWDGGLFRLSGEFVQKITVEGLSDDSVYSIAGYAGTVWVARKNGGVTRFQMRNHKFLTTTYTRQDGLAENSVYSLYCAADASVWAGTLEQGVSHFHAGQWRTYTTGDGLPSNAISAITGNGRGGVFVGTPNGLAEFTNNRWSAYSVHDGLPPGPIESLLLDHSGTLWIGTSKGISFLKSGKVEVPVGAPDALFGEIRGMGESDGWLWITTGNHVLRVKSSSLLNNSFTTGDYREFATTDGLPSVEGIKRSRSVVPDEFGRIWFSLNQGISALQPSTFDRPALPVTIRLDEMLIDGSPVDMASHIRVPAGRHRLTFRYSGVNISDPGTVRYRYRLESIDPGWSKPSALREVDYTNVQPGRFRFEVMARDSDGRWSGREAGISFEVEPAYWQTRWFQMGSAVGLVLLVWSLYRLGLRQMAARMNLRFSERLAERTRIARDLHDTLLQSFQGLTIGLQAVNDLLPEGKAKDQLEHSLQRADQAIAEGRNAVYDLRSSTTTTNDLAQAVRAIGEELALQQPAAFHLVVEGHTRDLHPIIRDEVYRIAREALRNAFNHACANHIEIEITHGDHVFRLRIRDDGKGIPPGVLEEGRSGHYGLPGMRERANQIGGKLEIWSGPKAGTEIELSIAAAIAYGNKTRRPLFRLFRGK